MEAVYLGMCQSAEAEPRFRFRVQDGVRAWRVSSAEDFALQNTLQIDRRFRLTLSGGVVTAIRPCDPLPPAAPAATLVAPGVRTLKNFLATALAPMGRALYVYGGGWNWQDTAAGPQATAVGLAAEWDAFFHAQAACYHYRKNGVYPENNRNPLYYAGLDCSGYLGWTLYNTLHRENGLPGYVCPASRMASALACRGWGQLLQGGANRLSESHPSREAVPASLDGFFESRLSCEDSFASADGLRPADSSHLTSGLRPGDVCSIDGHVWLCVGQCSDGSILLAHSAPTDSRSGCPGGGVQLSSLSPGGGSCEALELAESWMARNASAWYRRYAPVYRDWAVYTDFFGGVFRWTLDGSGILTDPDGFSACSAAEILKQLADEPRVSDENRLLL